MKMTESEWAVLEFLCAGQQRALEDVVKRLMPITGWSPNMVFTYLTRMENKGLVIIDRMQAKPYSTAVKGDIARQESAWNCSGASMGACNLRYYTKMVYVVYTSSIKFLAFRSNY